MNKFVSSLMALDLGTFFDSTLQSAVVAVLLLIVALVAASIAKSIVKKVVSSLFSRGVDATDDIKNQEKETANLIGNIAYAIVFMLFLPGALDRLGVSSVSAPITNMATKFLNYLPNLIAAGLVIMFGTFLAQLVKQLLTIALKKTKVDSLQEKAGINVSVENSISDVVGSFAYVVVLVLFVVSALQILNLDAISAPAAEMVNTIFGYIPSVFAAIILIIFGIFLANLTTKLLDGVLKGTGFDESASKLFPKQSKMSISNLISQIVRVVIIVFFVVSALNVLNIEVLSNVGNALIAYLPNIIASVLIVLVASIVANKVEELVVSANPKSTSLGSLLKYAIYVLAAFMTLTQLGIAESVVSSAFNYLLLAVGAAFVLAFGLGGRDWAAKKLEEFDHKKKR